MLGVLQFEIDISGYLHLETHSHINVAANYLLQTQ